MVAAQHAASLHVKTHRAVLFPGPQDVKGASEVLQFPLRAQFQRTANSVLTVYLTPGDKRKFLSTPTPANAGMKQHGLYYWADRFWLSTPTPAEAGMKRAAHQGLSPASQTFNSHSSTRWNETTSLRRIPITLSSFNSHSSKG